MDKNTKIVFASHTAAGDFEILQTDGLVSTFYSVREKSTGKTIPVNSAEEAQTILNWIG
jgi:hypothetical protein